jgi:hypothetical protein
MKLLKRIFRRDTSPEAVCKRAVRSLGFKATYGDSVYFKHCGSLDCMITISEKRVKLKVYSSRGGYSESEYIGPPLPNKEDLIAFIKSNI